MAPRVEPLIPQWSERWQSPMLSFARLHLSACEDAEDAVQDTWLAACQMDWQTPQLQDPRPYLFGILKHKVADRLRQRYRAKERELNMGETEGQALDEVLFDDSGHWVSGMAPSHWSEPDDRLHHAQFFALVDACVNRLSGKAAQVFSMKELLECEADEVCEVLAISKTDYWQNMSRARKQLQMCLNENGFGRKRP